MTITMNILMLAVVAVFCYTIGRLARRKQLTALQKRVTELEREMLDNHAEILELQKEKVRFTTPLSAALNDHSNQRQKHIA